jgi:putative Holliday junction resolvase
MGLDIGDRTVGVAVSDESGTLARGLGVIRRTSPGRDVRAVAELAAREGVGLIVAGLPRSLRGQIGPQAQKVLGFVAALREACPIPVELWDERLTTRIAEQSLRERSVSGRRRKAAVDRVAAAVILQGFLDARRRGREVSEAGGTERN